MRKLGDVLDSGVFPGTQGGQLEHVIAAKAIAFAEALSDDYLKYIVQVAKNAKVMADEFVKRGYKIISGGTDNHVMLIDMRSKNMMTGKQAEALIKADITINKNMVPFDTQSPMVTSGIRIGSPAITTRGLKKKDCLKVVDLIDEALKKPSDEIERREAQSEHLDEEVSFVSISSVQGQSWFNQPTLNFKTLN